MQYDPIKRGLGSVFNRTPAMRKFFYNLLDLLLLRSWHIHKELYIWAKNMKNKPVHILDAGAGFGQYTYWLSRQNPNWNILAVDVKKEQVRDCNKFFREIGAEKVLFRIEDLTKFVAEESFDLILSVDVMEHIEEDVLVFQNFAKSLKPGGMLIISTPSDQGGSDVTEEGESSFIEEHVRDGYNVDEIKNKILSAGFSKVEAYYSYGTPGSISWKLSMKYPIKLLGISKLFYAILPAYYAATYPFSFVLNWIDVNFNNKKGTGLIVKAWK